MNRTKLQEGTRALYGNQFLTRYFILHQMSHRMDGAMHRPGTEVQPLGSLPFGGNLHRRVDQLVDPFIFAGGNGDHRDPQRLLHLLDFNGSAVGPHLIHHI